MSKFVINSLSSVGAIHFGESRDEVRNTFGAFTEFKKTKFSKNTTDDFKNFHVYYTHDNKVEAVEFFSGSELEFEGKNLFEMKYSDFKFVDTDIQQDSSSITYKNLGFSVYSPSNEEIESIVVFGQGYYD